MIKNRLSRLCFISVCCLAILLPTLSSASGQTGSTAVISRPAAESMLYGTPMWQCSNHPFGIPFVHCECGEGSGKVCQIAEGDDPATIRPRPNFFASGWGTTGGATGGPRPMVYSNSGRPISPHIFSRASVIDNYTFNYVHASVDYKVRSSGAAGCATCSGGGGSGVNPWANFVLYRIFRSRDMSWNSSFGPGIFSNFDTQLYFGGAYNELTVFDPLEIYPRHLIAGANGTYTDTNQSYRSVTIFDAAGNPVTGVENASTAELVTHGGQRYLFEIVQANGDYGTTVDPDPYDPVTPMFNGRLTRYEDNNGQGVSITYRTWTPAELTASPERQWQIDTISTDAGQTATFTYNTQQVGGIWVIDSVSLPGGGSASYSYAGGSLAGVTLPDGAQASWSFSIDPNTQALVAAIDDPASLGEWKTKTVYLTANQHNNQEHYTVLNQASNLVRLVVNGNDEVVYANNSFSVGSGDINTVVYEGQGRARHVSEYESMSFGDDWSFMNQGTLKGSISGPLENDFVYEYSGGNNDWLRGKPNAITDRRGVRKELEYDANLRVTKVTYGDASYETYEYNSNGQVTRRRDRMGNVVRATYDAAGRILTQETGVLEISANPVQDQNQPEYALLQWQYYPSGHANEGLLKTEFSPLWDGSSADTHRTDYEYDANGRMTKKIGSASLPGGTRPEWLWTYDAIGRIQDVTDPEGHLTSYTYDSMSRLVRTTYDDGSTEETLYGSAGTVEDGLVVETKDRRNVVTTYSYDSSQRRTGATVGAAWDADILDGNPHDTPITDRNEQSITSYAYAAGTQQPLTVIRDGAKSEYLYDYRGRLVKTTTYPSFGQTLASLNVYDENFRWYSEDPYGRRTYYGYRASDGELVRVVKEAYPGEVEPELGAGGSSGSGGEAAYSSGYDAGYEAGYEDGYYWNPYDDSSTTGDPDYDQGFVHAYGDGYNDGQSDAYYGSWHGMYYMTSHGSSYNYSGGSSPPASDNNADLLALVRDANLNPGFVIKDMVQDLSGNQIQMFDERGIQHDTDIDSRGQAIRETKAVGTAVEAITETDYDAAGNVVEVRTPRYFDANDTHGFQKCRTVMTYDGADRVLTRTEAPGTAEEGVESYAYDTSGRQVSRTDARSKVWTTTYAACCGHSVASENPLGHGSITNQDNGGLVVHTAGVADVGTHVSLLNPDDAKTLQETTTRYDALGRSTASTTWLTPQALIDASNPLIAGFDGVSGNDGLTTQTIYDVNLTDGIGLDAAGGVTVTNPLGGNYTVDLTAALTKLAEPTAQGGAGLTFDVTAPGSAIVNLNAENEVSFSISDATGRSVMSGQMSSPVGQAASLLAWSCRVHDTTEALAGGETVLASISVDALGNTTKARTNGLGHSLESVDQESNVSTTQYDAAGNAVVSRDPNNVGFDAVFDELNRNPSRTDTVGSQTQSVYDKAGQNISAIDAKGKPTNYVYNARGQRITEVDRLGHSTHWSYDAAGNLLSLTDAESQTTSYGYDDAGQRITEQYPDHVSGAVIGDTGYGIITFTYDELGRRKVKEDQQGDTTTYNFDMAGRMLTRVYVGHPTGPLAGQSDTDTFTYDGNGRMLSGHKGRYNNTVTFTYDDRGQQLQETLTTHGQAYTVGYQKNELGQTTQLQYPDGSLVDRSYTDRGQLLAVDYTPNGGAIQDVADFVYDAGGRETTRNLGNGLTTTRSYFADNQIQSIATPGVEDLTYTYDANKNPTSEARSGVMAPYSWSTGPSGFDSEDRLVNWSRSNGDSQTWNLTAVHDWISTTIDGVLQSRSHGPAHEVVSMAGANSSNGTISLEYDAKGNLRIDDNEHIILSNFDNLVEQLDTSGGSGSPNIKYEYDVAGRRVAKTILVDGGWATTITASSRRQQICVHSLNNSNAVTREYVFGDYVDEPLAFTDMTSPEHATYYLHRNRQYSIYCLTNAAGEISEFYGYRPYGVHESVSPGGAIIGENVIGEHNITYTGREYDPERHSLYFRARAYSGSIGSFKSRDPLKYFDGTNIYSGYFAVRSVDPLGLTIAFDGQEFWEWMEENIDPNIKKRPDWPEIRKRLLEKYKLGCVGAVTCALGYDTTIPLDDCYKSKEEAEQEMEENEKEGKCYGHNIWGRPRRCVVFGLAYHDEDGVFGKPKPGGGYDLNGEWDEINGPDLPNFDFFHEWQDDMVIHANHGEPGMIILIDTLEDWLKTLERYRAGNRLNHVFWCTTCEKNWTWEGQDDFFSSNPVWTPTPKPIRNR